jgi:hypothetical protein
LLVVIHVFDECQDKNIGHSEGRKKLRFLF